MNSRTFLTIVRRISTCDRDPKVCIVGAGPAGFYTAQKLLRVWSSLFFIQPLILHNITNDAMSSKEQLPRDH